MKLLLSNPLDILFPLAAKTYAEASQTSKMELFEKIVNNLKPLTIFTKSSVLNVWLGSEDASLSKQAAMFKVDHWENRSSCNICLQFTIKPPKRNRKNERSHSDQIHVRFHKVKKTRTICYNDQGTRRMSRNIILMSSLLTRITFIVKSNWPVALGLLWLTLSMYFLLGRNCLYFFEFSR